MKSAECNAEAMQLERRRIFVLVTVSLACFANSYRGRFVFDDAEAIVNNRDVVGTGGQEESWWNLVRNDFWGTSLTSNISHKSWRPLTTLTFRLNFWISGLNPAGFHFVNIALHGIVVLLLYELVSQLLAHAINSTEKSKRIAYWCCLLFAAHPIHTECVASVVGRAELLCAVFYVLSVSSFIERLSDDKSGLKSNGWKLTRCVAYSTCSMLSKEQGITSLPMCILFDVLINSRQDLDHLCNAFKRRATDALNNNTEKQSDLLPPSIVALIKRSFFLCFYLCAQLFVRMWIMGFEPPTFTEVDNPASFHPNWLVRFINYNYLYALNIWLLMNPSNLCFDYSMGCIKIIESIYDVRILCVVVCWICICALVAQSFRCTQVADSKCFTLALLLMVVPFLPASNLLVRVGFVLAERVLYLPSIGFCLLVSLAFDTFRHLPSISISKYSNMLTNSLFVVLLLAFSLKCIHRNLDWADELHLYASGAKVCPNNAKVHYNLGKILNDFGSRSDAEFAYKNALKLHPNYDQAMNNLANLLKDRGNFEDAERLLKQAVKIRPNFAAAWMNLGIVKAALRKFDESELSYANALNYRKNYADCYFNLGNLYLEMGRESEALNAWLNATREKASHEKAWINIIILLDNRGDGELALHYASAALRHVSGEPGVYFAAANCLGKMDKFVESEHYFQMALQLDPDNANYYNNFGVLYHRWKKYDKAELMYKEALRLNPRLQRTKEHLRKIQKKLTKSVGTS